MASSSGRDLDLDALLRRVADGDAEAFASFYDATCARVFGLVVRVLRDPGYSEETTQEVYTQVWGSAAGFDPTVGSALGWLMTLAHRRAVDRVRAEVASNRREWAYGTTHIEPASDVVADAAVLLDERRQVAGCLGTLTEIQLQAIELAYYDGLTYAQVSERLSTSLGTVKSRMRDGLRKLRDCLGVS
ncbi:MULTISPECIES: sigma-70 family RNA polymerase sigma factor [unclassified Mycolicibacterium]|uniref:sigma-70 family RNA polymerase sigma factor n=1 Tax=unclassified Mycolicibacterium TaxID=2636767 RepID=UPI0012DD3433|nr:MULTISPECIES: sigma-70 family RNA polymerase sigma factor [unclassified Mycolicibacterium]MUL81440.1 sigma-70 family RNA polymerase sigma factor [Mycolicibacterium sp. CBMA 329]MUL87206.1 sigma-70 family RNA polymerase sigma factor [Mycolicibacterium sp. CBMA 331]MUL98512.1 sigma-70 family RNA polymerase sigma factor [Mycolicibacterium sp. CBMA 334]MUM25266.1 sigma-70 family RNA polymerase sigma factor [Mycolicibacterium sp. CBMA 295]MUM37503.1 sigma-70 family RNA polymerase sigma factor [M